MVSGAMLGAVGGHIKAMRGSDDPLVQAGAYRDPMTPSSTLDYLRTQTGRLLDPHIYDALGTVIRRGTVPGIPRIG